MQEAQDTLNQAQDTLDQAQGGLNWAESTWQQITGFFTGIDSMGEVAIVTLVIIVIGAVIAWVFSQLG